MVEILYSTVERLLQKPMEKTVVRKASVALVLGVLMPIVSVSKWWQ